MEKEFAIVIFLLIFAPGFASIIYKIAEQKKEKGEIINEKYFIKSGVFNAPILLFVFFILANLNILKYFEKRLMIYFLLTIFFFIFNLAMWYILKEAKKKGIFDYVEIPLLLFQWGIFLFVFFTILFKFT